jgi:D-inositol-3-phosphate glycosyltransferase
MRILFVLENYLPHIGGVEIVFSHLAEGLAKKGHQVTIVTHQLPGTAKEETLNGVKIVRVGSLDSRYVFTFTAIPAVLKHAKRADIIHTTTYNGAFPAWLGAKFRRKPSLITVHETWMGKWKEYSDFGTISRWMHELLEWLVYHIPRFDAYVCVSHSTEKMLKAALPERSKKIMAIHNGFDPAVWMRKYPTTELRKKLKMQKNFVIFAYGRPGTSKGFQYLFDAFPEIKKNIPNAVLVLKLSRDKQYAHVVKRMEHGAPEGIYFVDDIKTREQLATYVQMADCVVVPSITEGFGYAVLEAVAAGTPLVASNTTSIPEVVYGKHILIKPKDPRAIAEGVLAVKNGKYKNSRPKTFPWSKSISEYEKLYKRLK